MKQLCAPMVYMHLMFAPAMISHLLSSPNCYLHHVSVVSSDEQGIGDVFCMRTAVPAATKATLTLPCLQCHQHALMCHLLSLSRLPHLPQVIGSLTWCRLRVSRPVCLSLLLSKLIGRVVMHSSKAVMLDAAWSQQPSSVCTNPNACLPRVVFASIEGSR